EIVWHAFTTPAEVELDKLRADLGEVGAAALLGRHWPGKGTRQDAFLALAGALARAGWSEERTKRFVEALAAATKDDAAAKRVEVVRAPYHKQAEHSPPTGWPTLRELIGPSGKAVVRRVRRWLGMARKKADPTAGRLSNASRLVQLVRQAGVEVFHGDDERTFALVPNGQHLETWPLRSQRSRTWLSRLFYQDQPNAP